MFKEFWDKWGHVVTGAGGGTTKFILDVSAGSLPFAVILLRAAVVAGISAVVGMAAKDLYEWFKKQIFKR